MSDEQQAEVAAQLVEKVQHGRLHGGVQRRGDLVTEQQLWPGGQRPRDRNPLTRPAGELAGVALREPGAWADPLQQLGDTLARGRRIEVVQDAQRPGNPLADPPPWVQRSEWILRDQLDATALVDVHRLRIGLLVLTSLLTGVLVAVSGAIAFVGLIVPHVVRLVVGSNHRSVLPVAALVGATFLVVVDVAVRVVAPPLEFPLSIVTAAFGVPFFLWLLRHRDRSDQVESR